MKKCISYLLLAGFLFQVTLQLWILTIFYIQRDYIAANVCINRFDAVPVCKGQCYLVKELTENEKKQDQQFPDLKQKEIQMFVQVSHPWAPVPAKDSHPAVVVARSSQFISYELICSIFHPPRKA